MLKQELNILEPLPIGAGGGPIEAQLPVSKFCGLALITEAPRSQDIATGRLLSGPEGEKLDEMMALAGLDRSACLIAAPFRYQPADDDVANFFAHEARSRAEALAVNTKLPPYHGARCVPPHDDDVRALWRLLKQVQPRGILALGNTALWSVSWREGVMRFAGQELSTQACDAGVVPTWHPAHLTRRDDKVDEAIFLAHLKLAARIAGALPGDTV